MKNILVTGGAGYIGAHTCKALSQAGFHPIVFDNLSSGYRSNVKWGEFFEGDLDDRSVLSACFKKFPISAVMHFAASIEVGESVSNPAKYYQNNLCNSVNLFEAMSAHNIDKLVFSSSAAVYGNPEYTPIDEGHRQDPVNPYGKAKQMTEAVLDDFSSAYEMRAVRLRYFNAAGADPECEIGEAHDPESHLIPLILDAAAHPDKSISIYGTDYPTPDGTCIRDYIHVSDLARAHVLATEKLLAGMPGGAFNLGQGKGFSVKQVVEIAEKVTGRKIRVVAAPRRAGDPPILIASAEKAKDELGWQPALSGLDQIVRTAWQWHKKKTVISHQ